MVNPPAFEDLDVFLQTTGGFAVSGTVGGSSVDGILDQEWLEEGGFAIERIRFVCKASALPAITPKSTTAVIESKTYVVVFVEHQTGIAVLHLQEQS